MAETVLFDTHQVIKRFIAVGFTEKQAEVIMKEQKSIIENNLANKKDIAEINLRIETFRKETKQDIAEINLKIENLKQKTHLKIENLKQETHLKIENLRQEMNKEIALVRKDIDLMGKKILNKMYVSLFACFGLFTTVITVIIKFL